MANDLSDRCERYYPIQERSWCRTGAAITKLMAETGHEVKLIDVEKEKEVKKIKEKV